MPISGNVVFDLSATQFISPGGLVGLCLLGRAVCDHGQPLSVLLSDRIAGYVCRMGLHEYFRHVSHVSFDPQIDTWAVRRRDRRGDLVELTPVAVHDDDQVNAASGAVAEVLWQQVPDIGHVECDAIVSAVAELLSNVYLHSGEIEGIMAVQAYRGEVILSIGDTGRGIRESLNTLHGPTIRTMTDGEMLFYATNAGVCGTRVGGGMGLYMQRYWVETRGVAFHLMSGSGYVAMWRGGVSAGVDMMAHSIQGTLTEMHIER